MAEPCKKVIVNKIEEILKDEPENLPRVLLYLSEDRNTPVWETLEVLLDKPDVFELMVKAIAEKTKPVETSGDDQQKAVDYVDPDTLLLDESVEDRKFVFCSLPKKIGDFIKEYQLLIALVPAALSHKIIEALTNSAANKTTATVKMLEYGGSVVTSVVAGIRVITVIIRNIRRCQNGEIIAERCVKNICDSLGEVASGYGGMVAGAALCASGGPLGILIGGLLGAVLGGAIGSWTIRKITRIIFDLPQTESVEKAYKDLCVSRAASNASVNQAFDAIIKKADADEVIKAKQAMKIIKLERQS